MKTYQIEATKIQVKAVGIKANNEAEAAEYFRQRHKGYNIENVGDRVVLGRCEVSGKFILEGDAYEQDSEGVMWLVSEGGTIQDMTV